MKFLFTQIYLCLTFICLIGCTTNQDEQYAIPKSEQAVNNLLDKIAVSLRKEYKMKPVATNVAMPGGVVKLLGLDFQIIGPLSRDEIRKVLIESAQDFLACVNSDEAVRPYLENYPFEIKNIEIILFVIGSKGIRLDDPYIGIAGMSYGKLFYETLITTDIPTTKSEFKETYEEAVQALHIQLLNNPQKP